MCKIVEEYGDERAAEALQKGIELGEKKKAVEDAVRIIKKYNATPEDAAKDVDAPLNLVLETLELQKSVAVKA